MRDTDFVIMSYTWTRTFSN